MQVFDASSMIYAWDNYPIGQFPPLWKWMTEQVQSQAIVMSRVAYDEVVAHAPACAQWLTSNSLGQIAVTNAVLLEAARIKGTLGIINDKYGSGVGENDLIIIATAQLRGATLVSDEAKQATLPAKLANCKIPAVCAMQNPNLSCISFLDCIKQSNEVFG